MKKRLYLFLLTLTLMQGCSLFFAPGDDEDGTRSSHPASISRINGINTLTRDTALADPPQEEEQ